RSAVKFAALSRASIFPLPGKTRLTTPLRRTLKKVPAARNENRAVRVITLSGKNGGTAWRPWTPAMGNRRRLHSLRKLLFRPRVDLPRDRLHPQCRGTRRAHRDYHFLRQPRAGRPLPRDGRRPPHLRFNDLNDPQPIPRDTDYASVFESDVPIIVQHTRLDSRRAEVSLLSTVAYAEG